MWASFDPLLHRHPTVEEKDFVSSNPYDQQQKQFFLSIAKALFSYPRPLQSHLQESIFSTKVMGKRKREEMHHGLSAPVSASCRWDLCISASTNHLRYRLYKVQASPLLIVSTSFERPTWMMLWCNLNLSMGKYFKVFVVLRATPQKKLNLKPIIYMRLFPKNVFLLHYYSSTVI